jgi:glycosyltransferase involved in cell wall biosynthesis
MTLRILAIEPYYGGSHQAFLDGWIANSVHTWDTITLPPHSWKWRMRHAAIHAASQIQQLQTTGKNWDVVFCSDMLNLAELKGLQPRLFSEAISVLYFHENQLTYPAQTPREWDHHFVFTNFTSALAADHVWWNSQFNQNEFIRNLPAFLQRMPDYQPLSEIDSIAPKSEIHYPPVDVPRDVAVNQNDIPILCWAARWEFDKDPATFFEAIRLLREQGAIFRLSVIGESFRDSPKVFAEAESEFADIIQRWGYQPSRQAYLDTLTESDIFVSTAIHEFFGITAVESIACGCFPMLPERLAYPEVLQLTQCPERGCHFFDGSAQQLAAKLAELIRKHHHGNLWPYDSQLIQDSMCRYRIKPCVQQMDQRLVNYAAI